jgi:hypothetical protein
MLILKTDELIACYVRYFFHRKVNAFQRVVLAGQNLAAENLFKCVFFVFLL